MTHEELVHMSLTPAQLEAMQRKQMARRMLREKGDSLMASAIKVTEEVPREKK